MNTLAHFRTVFIFCIAPVSFLFRKLIYSIILIYENSPQVIKTQLLLKYSRTF